MDIRIIACSLTLLLATTLAFSGEIQRWEDQDGHVHFGDTAPIGTNTTKLSPEIITTAPSENTGLTDILRPGERRMLEKYEQRGKTLSAAKSNSLKQDRQKQKKLAQAESRCNYHRQKKEDLERQLRHGYKPSLKKSTKLRITKEQQLIEKYCN